MPKNEEGNIFAKISSITLFCLYQIDLDLVPDEKGPFTVDAHMHFFFPFACLNFFFISLSGLKMEKVQYYTHDITKTGVLSEVPLLTLHAIKFQEASILTFEAKNAASRKLYFFH